MKDANKIKGIFSLKVFKGEELIEDYTENNLVVATGRSKVAAMIGGEVTDKFVSSVEVGTNGTAPSSSDTAITAPFSVPVSVSYPAPGEVQFDWVLGSTQNNGVTIAEYGLVCEDGTLFARKTRATIAKDSSIRLEGTWKVIF